jgi:UDPglucose 6-dehydrogenase
MDIDQKKVELLQQGHVSIFEPGLASLVRESQDARR